MSHDLVVRNATLVDGRTGIDVACAGGRIVAVGAKLDGKAPWEIDARGQLLSPPFVDAHFHLDAALSLGRPRLNRSGTLLEGIEVWGELKAVQTAEEIVERALRYVDLAVAQGILALRSHVDVSTGLVGVEALLEVREQVGDHLHLELVAFPQDGFLRSTGAERHLLDALDRGVEVVGGIPHFERTAEEGAASVRRLLAIAAERGLPVDMHCDETDDPMSRHVETLAREALRHGLQGRVTGSHLTSMHGMDGAYVAKLIPLMAEAGLNVVANPLVNVFLQGRHDGYPKRRGLTRVAELKAAGLRVALGSDCMMDPWYPLGTADMLEVASMAIHLGHLSSGEAMRRAFDAVTLAPARILGLDGYGVEVGASADFVLLQAGDPIEAIRTRAARLAVVRRGRVVAETPPRQAILHLEGRPNRITPRLG